MIGAQRYLKAETALTRVFLRVWRPLAPRLFAPVATALDAGDFPAAYDAAAELDLRPVTATTMEHARYWLWSAAVVGSEIAAGRKQPVFPMATYDRTMARVARQLASSIERTMLLAINRNLVQLIATKEQEAMVKKSAAPKRYVREFVDFEETGDAALQLVSSQHSSRLAVWGFTAEAEFRDVEEYQLNNVLDGRTSEICRVLHGRKFRVEHARTKIIQALDVDDAQALRVVHPWPKQSRKDLEAYKAMSSDELRSLGILVPPFHPWCRTLCQLVEKSAEVLYLPTSEPYKDVVSPASFEAMGAIDTPNLVEKWNQTFGLQPATVLSGATGLDQDEVFTQVLGKQRFFQFLEDGSMKIKAKGALAGEGSNVALSLLYDPVAGALSQLQAEVTGVSPAKFVPGHYQRMAALTATLGGARLLMGAAGADALYVHARMGFVASTTEAWSRLQASIELDVTNGLFDDVFPVGSDARNLLLEVLSTHDLKGLWALAAMPGAAKLLRDRTMTVALAIADAEAMGQFNEVLPP